MSQKQITIASESIGLYTTKRMLLEAKKLSYNPHWLNPYQFLLSIPLGPKRESTVNKTLPVLYFHRTSGIRYDDFDLMVSRYHESTGQTITNPLSSLEIFRNKDRQILFFAENNLPSIQTIEYRGELSDSIWEIISKLSQNQKFIIKMIRGNQGIGVNLVNGLQSLKSFLETFHAIKDQKFIIQPFIEHKREWRVFMIKNEIIGIIERTLLQDEDFRGNSKRSLGKMIKVLPKAIEEVLLLGVAQSGLDYCGVDIIDDGDNFSFLEFNPVPGFEQLENLSGLNIARELIVKL